MNRMARAQTDWIDLGLESWRLWQDSAAVIWLRGARIAQGGVPAANEAQRMVAEKLAANAALMIDVATGAAGLSPHAVATSAVGLYGRKVRANRRRLTR